MKLCFAFQIPDAMLDNDARIQNEVAALNLARDALMDYNSEIILMSMDGVITVVIVGSWKSFDLVSLWKKHFPLLQPMISKQYRNTWPRFSSTSKITLCFLLSQATGA